MFVADCWWQNVYHSECEYLRLGYKSSVPVAVLLAIGAELWSLHPVPRQNPHLPSPANPPGLAVGKALTFPEKQACATLSDCCLRDSYPKIITSFT